VYDLEGQLLLQNIYNFQRGLQKKKSLSRGLVASISPIKTSFELTQSKSALIMINNILYVCLSVIWRPKWKATKA